MSNIQHKNQKAHREIFAWVMYDFSSSAFGTSIVAVIFNQYFANVVARGEQGIDLWGWHIQGASFFAFTLAFGTTGMALISPALGAIADYSGAKKRFLIAFWAISVLFTGTLYWVREGDYALGALLFLMACFGYYGSLNFYNAFLLQIATPTTIGRISGWGNALGFLGGGLILTVNLVMVKPSLLGFSWPPFTVPEVTVSVAFWMLVFALPVLIWLRERTIPCSLPPGERLLLFGFRRAWETLRQLKHYRQLSRYFLAYLVFNDGISTAMFMASIFGAQVLGMKPDELILYFLATQATGLVGSLLFGYWGDRIGQRRALMVTLVLWSLIVLWAFQLGIGGNPKAEFWVIGLLAGIALGGNLVVSRSLAGALMPAEKAAEFFGFLGVAGRFAAVLGPLVYGISIELTGSLQKSILSLLVFFLLGMLLLLRVNEREGTREREFHFR